MQKPLINPDTIPNAVTPNTMGKYRISSSMINLGYLA
jgi:hypothetical protein